MAIDRGDPNYGTGTAASTGADEISVTDSGDRFTATDVEGVLSEIEDSLNTHIADTTDPHQVTATQVSITDAAGNYTATDVEAALAEVYSSPPTANNVASTGELYGALLTADGANSSSWGQKVWKDLKGIYRPDSGVATPNPTTFIGSNIDERLYGAGDGGDWMFHMPHDYAVGTDIHLHVHWMHNGTGISGTYTIDFEITYANRNATAPFSAFSTPITPSLSNSATINITNYPQHCHAVEEFQLSASTPSATQLDTDDLAVDGVLLVHMVATTVPTVTGGSAGMFISSVDIHYQADIEGTKNKDPNYYS